MSRKIKAETRKEVEIRRSRFTEIVGRFKTAKVMVVGDFMLDQFIWGKVRRISPEAPVPVVEVQRESYMPGGALNSANNIVSLGAKVFPCGVLGRDLHGRMLIKAMKKYHVDTGGVIYDAARPTSQKTRIIAHSQQVVRFDREISGDISTQDLNKIVRYAESKIKEIDGIVIEDYGKGVITPLLIRKLLKLAKKYKKFVLVDPKDRHFSYYKGVTVITPNRKEAAEALGLKDAYALSVEEMGKKLLVKCKCQAVLVTLGEDGMMLMEKNGKTTKISTRAKEVFDVSGAGDTVVAVFALALAGGATLQEAAFISNLAAGIVVGKIGTATVQLDELTRSFSESN